MSVVVGSQKPLIGQLTGLRAIAAVGVLVIHFQEPMYALVPATTGLRNIVDAGGLGLILFFLLSGFIITYTYGDRLAKLSRGEYGRFLWSRLARMYPVHFTMLMIILLLVILAKMVNVNMPNSENYRADSFVANLFMLQAFFPEHPWNAPAWTLTCEYVAYIIFPLMAVLIIRFRSATAAFASAAAVIIGGVVVMILVLPSVDTDSFGGVMMWLHITFEFTCGALLYIGWRNCKNRQGLRWDLIAAGALVSTLVILGVMGNKQAWQFVTIPLLALFVLGSAGAVGPVKRFLSLTAVQWLGRVSYSFYLVHVTVRSLVRQVLPPETFSDSWLILRVAILGVYFVAPIVCAGILYHFVEEPSRKAMRSWLARHENRAIAAKIATEPKTPATEAS